MRPPLSAFCCKLAHYRCLLTPTEVARYGFYHPFVSCLSVSQHFISKADAARITKLTQKCFKTSSGNLGVKRSKVKVTSQRNIAGVGVCTFASAGCLWFIMVVIVVVVIWRQNEHQRRHSCCCQFACGHCVVQTSRFLGCADLIWRRSRKISVRIHTFGTLSDG